MKMGLPFDAKDHILKDVLFSLRKFQVPRFQRPYACQTGEVSAFWDDFIDAVEGMHVMTAHCRA